MKTIHCVLALVPALAAPACTSKSSSPDLGSPGGPVAGAADNHCGSTVVTVDPAKCDAVTPESDGGAVEGDDGGIVSGGGDEFGATMFGTEGDDDDCKFHMKWSGTPRRNEDATITVVVTTKADGKPLTGAKPYIEADLGDTHPAPNSPDSTEPTPGTYSIPVKFDAAGRWVMRFHFNAECADDPASPHGHAAFFVNIP